VAGNDSKVADGGGSTFSVLTVVHGLTQDFPTPKVGFLSFLVLSSRSFPSPIALRGGKLVLMMFASISRVQSKAGKNSGVMAAYL
jgi:hypothetical protein